MLILSAPILVLRGGSNVIGFAMSGAVGIGDFKRATRLASLSGGIGSTAWPAGPRFKSASGHVGHGSVNGSTMRRTNKPAMIFLTTTAECDGSDRDTARQACVLRQNQGDTVSLTIATHRELIA